VETLVVYSRRGCHLCEVLVEELLPLVDGRLELEIRDVDTDPAWLARFSKDVPVVEFADRIVCRHFLDREAIEGILRG
jgi:hypothetical protein